MTSDREPDLAELELEVERSILRDSFADFATWAWPLITGAPLVPNRATTAVIAALQRVADGELLRLAVAMPPGVGKSTLLACYAAWRRVRDPSWRSIHACHAAALAETESRRVRRLVEGDDYRRLFGVRLREDESTVAAWATTAGGLYVAIGVGGALTGRRAREAVIDDPLNAPDRFSRAARDGVWAWFSEALLTRLDGDRAPTIVVHQRLDRDDLIGRLVERGGWELLELPAEDAQGELLAPNVLGRDKLEVLRVDLGAAAYTTQYLQRPSDDASALVQRSWWRFWQPRDARGLGRPSGCDTASAPVVDPGDFNRVVIAADLTFGSATGDYNAIVVIGAKGGARYVTHLWRERAGFQRALAVILELRAAYPRATVLVEKAANGAAIIETLKRRIPAVIAITPQGSKHQRLSAVAPQIEAGSVYLPIGGAWAEVIVEECAGASKHDDAMDAVVHGLTYLETSSSAIERFRALSDLGDRPTAQRSRLTFADFGIRGW